MWGLRLQLCCQKFNMQMTKILYLEDELHLGRIVKESLQSRNYDIKLVSDGKNVMAAFDNFKPDICVLDVMVPNVDGFTLGLEIRKKNQHIPIVFLTAKNQTDDVLQGFQSGGNDYIKKPFSMEELIVRIENLLTIYRKNVLKSKTQLDIEIGSYTFSYSKFELRHMENIRNLSHRENELLKLLCDNLNTTIERKDILLKLWGDDSMYNSRNLDVYIRKIRQYFESDKRIKLVTLRGVGYHFTVTSSNS